MGHITDSHVELEADRSGWKQVYVIETDVELDSANDDYDVKAVEELMDELLKLRRSTRFKLVRVWSRGRMAKVPRRPSRRGPARD
jgi:hypothetical protein